MRAIFYKIPKNKENLAETAALVVFFMLLSFVSYFHVDRSISVFKYFVGMNIKELSENYFLYHHSFKDFFYHTSSFFRGSSVSGWNSIIYLLPLFIFCDLLGGVSLITICLFTVTTLLIFLVLFYFWIRRIWGRQAALWGTLLLGSSAIFQEIARSGSYIAFSFLIVIIWISYCFSSTEPENSLYSGILGFWTGLLWYGYGLIRGLTLVAVARTWRSNGTSKWAAIGLFLAGMMIVIIPGVVVMFKQHWNYHGPWHFLFVDQENILDEGKWNFYFILKIFSDNLNIFVHRMLGRVQIIDYKLCTEPHARFLHPYFVVPMLTGIWCVFRSWKLPSNQLLIWMSFMVFIMPMLSSTHGYNVARRSLFYIIPIYCFIGLGCKEILDWINRHDRISTKWLMKSLIVGIILIALNSEMKFVQDHIISSRRDMGLLEFADKIKKMGTGGDLYYLERDKKELPNTPYRRIVEGDVMRVALMGSGQSIFEVKNVTPNVNLTYPSRYLYLAKSPVIPQKEFNDWALRNKLKYKLILESPFRNKSIYPYRGFSEPFKFYAVYKTQ